MTKLLAPPIGRLGRTEGLGRIGCFAFWTLGIMWACGMQSPELSNKAPSGAVVEYREGPSAEELSRETVVVMLGTGTPIPSSRRAGASVAVIHKGEAYLFDVGGGAVRNATVARYRYDIPSLYPTQICCVFLTHLHNDHTQDLAELATSMWWRRRWQLRVWGPPGLADLLAGVDQLMGPDRAIRMSGNQPIRYPDGAQVQLMETKPGIVFAEGDLTIEAFDVSHGNAVAFGFRIVTDNKSVVISGDTTYSETLLEKARGVDVLIHEVISDAGLLQNDRDFQDYHRASHTRASELARLATEAQPSLLVLYHGLLYGLQESVLLDEVRAGYSGETVLANDLDVF